MSPRLVFAVLFLAFPLSAGAESFKSWAARGAREEREKDPKAAEASYGNALSLWDEDDGAAAKAKVLCARGAIRDKNGDDAGALEDYSGCLALDKKNAKIFHRRGQLYIKAGKTTTAMSDFYKAVSLNPAFGEAYHDRAKAYESQGEMGFAREDYQHACDFGAKAACAKAKALAPKATAKKKGKGKAKAKDAAPGDAVAPEGAPAEDAAPAEESAPAEETAAEEPAKDAAPAGAPAKKKKSGGSGYYYPKYRDCLDALNACVDAGDSFGTCVSKAPNCDKKTVKGCCPAACLKAHQKAINRGLSEAEAFRENFSPDAACGIPPKGEEDD